MSSKVRARLFRLISAALHRAGAQTKRLGLATGRNAGLLIQWRPDEPGLLRGAVAPVEVAGETLRFFVADDFDTIQGCHRRGKIYEPEELALIARHYSGGTFVDVGANVGNHAVYMLRIAGAARVVAFEPEPSAAQLCRINLALNGCAAQAEVREIGLSDRSGRAASVLVAGDLGQTHLAHDPTGPIELAVGDELLAGEPVGFIKVDTEGHELAVLGGLRKTILRERPPLFVEVENGNRAAFEGFCAQVGYAVADEYRRDEECSNLLALPR